MHETWHALGLPHSADAADVMFPATQVDVLSTRDQESAQLLYRLPPGSVKDLALAP
jgi:predicted Zn-dependent protease